ncbi:MAG: hypothetical protein PHP38_08750, partial [Sphaerochaetaceae bacterium]|nr:hypothetical protein [Sphaerochaetaceae bacterium]
SIRTLGALWFVDKSRMNREIHVRFRESLGVKFPLATRLRGWDLAVPAYSICSVVIHTMIC